MATTWVPDVSPDTPFSLANLPFGIISTPGDPSPRAAVAIGDYALDLKALSSRPELAARALPPGLLTAEGGAVFAQPTLNAFAALGRPLHRAVRESLRRFLQQLPAPVDLPETETETGAEGGDAGAAPLPLLVPRSRCRMHLPMSIGDYTDFYAGYHHAYEVGRLFRGPDNALQPNYTHLPVGYHGRASSIVVSGTPVRRPRGQILPPPPPAAAAATAANPAQPKKQPITSPSRRLDMELELGCLIGRPNDQGREVPVDEADGAIFGYVLLNDWSARDIQAWEYVPLGPFNGKNFASTVSPWVVLADALEPFRARAIDNPNPAELQGYLREAQPRAVFDIALEVELQTAAGRSTTITTTSSRELMWSFPQMIAHHTLGGCPLRTGDLLGSGTISGAGRGEKGSLLEMSAGGSEDVALQGGEVRRFLQDGDVVVLRGACGEPGQKVGFGECAGQIVGYDSS